MSDLSALIHCQILKARLLIVFLFISLQLKPNVPHRENLQYTLIDFFSWFFQRNSHLVLETNNMKVSCIQMLSRYHILYIKSLRTYHGPQPCGTLPLPNFLALPASSAPSKPSALFFPPSRMLFLQVFTVPNFLHILNLSSNVTFFEKSVSIFTHPMQYFILFSSVTSPRPTPNVNYSKVGTLSFLFFVLSPNLANIMCSINMN